ncbi:hypothetical protein DYBT9623_05346 [Dyadobacter sp. CECT 9623]|uniref:Uncharacterized protein n=1 Tax=Dyadobacter linearis TaxID=2823330 RepID=A0ABM8UYH9_9BACT|nr:hypothetical protein [Dyadobacter sp. CECT 9623]CAG5074659.1 hypothetical protein DYBT9623_05346 [Dyadobacter sp. CECT 9623]
MKALKKIVYILLALSLLPVLTTYFAYGKKLEMVFFAVTVLFVIGLLYLIFATSKRVAVLVLILGAGIFVIQLTQLNELWFNNEGGDLRVPIAISLQSIFTVIVLGLLMRDNKVLSSKNRLDKAKEVVSKG